MLLEKRIIAFARLGGILRRTNREFRVQPEETSSLKRTPQGADSPGSLGYSGLSSAIKQAQRHNGWFTEENILLALVSLGEMLREDKLRTWIKKYPEADRNESNSKRVGVIMAGNIPLVGFHDFLCVLMSGNVFVGKLASQDAFLLPAIVDILLKLEPEFKSQISLVTSPIKSAEAFIATGSNNSARYFQYYFKKHPHIIRKNRNSIAIMDGKESETDLINLGKDIFQYFGMGCRNISKIYIPENYNLDRFFSTVVDFGDVINHNKYYNNHQYYRTIYLLNNEKFLDNNFLMLKETFPNSTQQGELIASPVATVYYERYNNWKELLKKLVLAKEQIQCIVSNLAVPSPFKKVKIGFGHTQSPEPWDYADGVDTMRFLSNIK